MMKMKLLGLLLAVGVAGCASNPNSTDLATATLIGVATGNPVAVASVLLASAEPDPQEKPAIVGTAPAEDAEADITPVAMESSGVTRQYRCADLTSSEAQQLLLAGHSYLDADGDGDACEPDARRDYAPATTSSNCHWVSGYTRKNGTRVRGHQRCR